jgi:hypothetical protein
MGNMIFRKNKTKKLEKLGYKGVLDRASRQVRGHFCLVSVTSYCLLVTHSIKWELPHSPGRETKA